MKNSIKVYLIILPIVLMVISNSFILIGLAVIASVVLAKSKRFRKLAKKSYQENCRLEKILSNTAE